MDTSNTPMVTVSAVLEHLRKQHKDVEFRYEPDGLTAGRGKYYQPEEIKILKTYRFEGYSDPADMAAIYLLEAEDGLQGYVLDAYGAHSNLDTEFSDFLRKVPCVPYSN